MRKIFVPMVFLLLIIALFAGIASASPADVNLGAAIERGDADGVREALRLGADANALLERKGFDGNISYHPALVLALMKVNDHPDAILALIEGGADVNAGMKAERADFVFPPLQLLIARMTGERDTAKMDGMLGVMEAMIEHGTDVNRPLDMNEPGAPRMEVFYPIHDAAQIHLRDGAIRAIKMLLDNGVPVDMRTDKSGITPIMIAALSGGLPEGCDRSALVRFLVDRGADINAVTTEEDVTPIYAAIYCAKTTRTMIELGARVDVRNEQGISPFAEAVINGDPEAALVIYRHERALRKK